MSLGRPADHRRIGASPDPLVCVVGPGARFLSGVSQHTVQVANCLAGDGSCCVLAILMRQLLPTFLYPGRERVGKSLTLLGFDRRVRVFDGLDWFWFPSVFVALLRLVRARPNALVLQWWSATVLHSYLLLAVVARLLGCRVLIEFHEVLDSDELRLRWVRAYVRAVAPILLRLVSAFVVHSRRDVAVVRQHYGISDRPFEVITPAALLPPEVCPDGGEATGREGWREAPPCCCNLLFFGVVRPYKGIEDLILAFNNIPSSEIDRFWLTIVGETWEGWVTPRELVERSPYRHRITLVDRYVHEAEVPRIFSSADAVVLPYRRSSASGPVHLTMSHGLPLVVTDVGGLGEAVKGYEGAITVQPGRCAELTDAMVRAAEMRGRPYADPHSWERNAARYRAVITAATRHGSRRRPARRTLAAAPPPDPAATAVAAEPDAVESRRPAVYGGAWGWLPVLACTGAFGDLVVAVADNRARASASGAETLFWIGLLVLFVPIAFRLLLPSCTRRERLGLVLVLGLGLYVLSLLWMPIRFTGPDALGHLRTAQDILGTHRLFAPNPNLPISSVYPGLESVVAATVSLTGLPVFAAGNIVIGTSRVVLLLALFLFFEEVSGSDRVAGIASLLYMANPSFTFFDASFSYETMALALAMLTLYVTARLSRTGARRRLAGAAVCIGLTITATAVTHHVTSYALIGFLLLWTVVVLCRLGHRGVRARGSTRSLILPAGAAAMALAVNAVWLSTIAGATIGYLAPHLVGGATELVDQLSGHAPTRQLFRPQAGALPPLWERAAAIASVLLILSALPLGALHVWRRHRHDSLYLAAGIATLIYPLSLLLRFTELGAEASERASEFAFVPIGLVLAAGLLESWLPAALRRVRVEAVGAATLFAGWATVVFVGGVIVGEPDWARLPGPYLVAADARSVEPQGLTAAYWARTQLGPGHRVATDRTNRLLWGAYGAEDPVGGYNGPSDSVDVFVAPKFDSTVLSLLRRGQVRYVVVDRRTTRGLPLVGYYYEQGEPATFGHRSPLPLADIDKFDAVPGISKVYDSGDIEVYDVGALTGAG